MFLCGKRIGLHSGIKTNQVGRNGPLESFKTVNSTFSTFAPKHIAGGFYSCSSRDQFLNSAPKAKCHSLKEKRNRVYHFDKPKHHLPEGDAFGPDVQRREGGRKHLWG